MSRSRSLGAENVVPKCLMGSCCRRVRHVAVAKNDAVDVGDLLCLIEEGEEPVDPTRSLDCSDVGSTDDSE